MVTVSAGTDTYGRVKSVRGTPIVTKFAMLQFLPIWPLQSLYFTGSGTTETSGVPFIANYQSVTMHGIQLAKIDRTSVCMAYVRGAFATLVVVGFIGVLVPGIMYLTGEHLDDFAMTLLRWLSVMLTVGAVGGISTYLIPFTTAREREIRTYCEELLGIAIDPSRLPSQTAKLVHEFAEKFPSLDGQRRQELIRDLVCTRVKLADRTECQQYETATDDILMRLQQEEHSALTSA